MGGRGSASNITHYTAKQKARVDGLKRMAEKYGYKDVKIKMGKDGAVNYEYTEKTRVTEVHKAFSRRLPWQKLITVR